MGEDGVLTYVNSKTGETTTEKPPFFAGGDDSGWVKVQGPDGEWVYVNTETGETSTEEPEGWTGSDWVTVVNEDGSVSYVNTKTGETTDEKPMELQDMEGEWIAVMGGDGGAVNFPQLNLLCIENFLGTTKITVQTMTAPPSSR